MLCRRGMPRTPVPFSCIHAYQASTMDIRRVRGKFRTVSCAGYQYSVCVHKSTSPIMISESGSLIIPDSPVASKPSKRRKNSTVFLDEHGLPMARPGSGTMVIPMPLDPKETKGAILNNWQAYSAAEVVKMLRQLYSNVGSLSSQLSLLKSTLANLHGATAPGSRQQGGATTRPAGAPAATRTASTATTAVSAGTTAATAPSLAETAGDISRPRRGALTKATRPMSRRVSMTKPSRTTKSASTSSRHKTPTSTHRLPTALLLRASQTSR